MGCGKSTVGKQLANKIEYSFVDLDELIVEKAGKSIVEIFEQHGEPFFRQLERDVLAGTCNLQNVVIATGGGAPCFFDNVNVMNQSGITIYIKMPAKAIISRLSGDINKRPVLKGKTSDELLSFITDALKHREPFYNQAKITVDGINLSAGMLISAIEKYGLLFNATQ